MESVLEAPTATQAETPAETTKGKKAKKAAAPSPETKLLLKRLEEQHKLGESVKRKDAQRAKQETVCAEAKAELDSERETLHKYERELEELKDDLTNLAVGGFVDRLPFKDPKSTPAAPTNGQAAPSSPDAWKSVPLADVWREAGANVTLLALLADGKIKAGPRKGQVAEIRTLGDLAAFTSNPHAKLTDISGVGAEKAGAIEKAVDTYWEKHPQGLTATLKELVSGLDWKPMSDTQHFADTRFIKPGEGKSVPQFAVTLTDGECTVDQTNGCLMPDTAPGTFKSVGEARAWCQRREDELLTASKVAVPEGLENASVSVNGSEFVPVADVMKVWDTKPTASKKATPKRKTTAKK